MILGNDCSPERVTLELEESQPDPLSLILQTPPRSARATVREMAREPLLLSIVALWTFAGSCCRGFPASSAANEPEPFGEAGVWGAEVSACQRGIVGTCTAGSGRWGHGESDMERSERLRWA
jgi:hypothetical protein